MCYISFILEAVIVGGFLSLVGSFLSSRQKPGKSWGIILWNTKHKYPEIVCSELVWVQMFAVYFLSYEIKDTMSQALAFKDLFARDSPAVASEGAVCLLYIYIYRIYSFVI